MKLECAICQDNFKREDKVCQLPCHVKHIYHSACIKPWIRKQNCCPLCKEKVEVTDTEIDRQEELEQRNADVRI